MTWGGAANGRGTLRGARQSSARRPGYTSIEGSSRRNQAVRQRARRAIPVPPRPIPASDEVSVPAILTGHMVLQGDRPKLMPLLIEIGRLHFLSRSRRIVIAFLSSSNGPLSSQSWLNEHPPDCFRCASGRTSDLRIDSEPLCGFSKKAKSHWADSSGASSVIGCSRRDHKQRAGDASWRPARRSSRSWRRGGLSKPADARGMIPANTPTVTRG
jgi:hypothetical protein